MPLCLVFVSLSLPLPLALSASRESGYAAVLGKLVPLRASPMNDVLIGWPGGGPLQEAHSPELAGAETAGQPMAAEGETADGPGGRQIGMPYRDLAASLETESLLAAPR